jgi:peptidoglycan/xylan/chitin deacetylase (PgdA/CDA1 family)
MAAPALACYRRPDTSEGLVVFRLRSIIRKAVAASLYYTGVFRLLLGRRLRHRVAILTYHRVLPRDRQELSFSAPGIVVTPETFDLHMRLLRRYLNPIDVSTLVHLISSDATVPPRTCVVTFDDGWQDNLEFALPILRRHEIPAVFFATTAYIGSSNGFWQERLAQILFRVRQFPDTRPLFVELGLTAARSAEPDEARAKIRGLIDRLKLAPSTTVRQVLATLEHGHADLLDLNVDRFLSWDELAKLSGDSLVTIGSHTRSHVPLTRMPLAEVEAELTGSVDDLQQHLGFPPAVLAYPNGDVDAGVAAAARRAGYVAAFTTRRGLFSVKDDPFLVPRLNIHESSSSTPAEFLMGLLAFR